MEKQMMFIAKTEFYKDVNFLNSCANSLQIPFVESDKVELIIYKDEQRAMNRQDTPEERGLLCHMEGLELQYYIPCFALAQG